MACCNFFPFLTKAMAAIDMYQNAVPAWIQMNPICTKCHEDHIEISSRFTSKYSLIEDSFVSSE